VVHLSSLDPPRVLAHRLQDTGARTLVATDLTGLLPSALHLLEQGAIERLIVGEDALCGRLVRLPTGSPTA
jgi:long-chain acyl-CoA synthetase